MKKNRVLVQSIHLKICEITDMKNKYDGVLGMTLMYVVLVGGLYATDMMMSKYSYVLDNLRTML